MINENVMKLRSLVFLALIVAAIECLTGCLTVHTSSIAAHDSLHFPTVGMRARKTVSEGGFVLKTTPTFSVLDDAYTHSIQGGYVHSVVIPLFPNAKLSLAGGVSGYFARNTLSGVFEGTEQETKSFNGYGFTGQFKPALFFGSRGGRFMLGGNFVYNKEFGEYLDFRHTFDALNVNYSGINKRVDYSPHGQTFSMTLNPGFAYVLDKDCSVLVELGVGTQFTDFVWDNHLRWLIYSLTLSYTGKHYWVWVGNEWFPGLNTGLTLGAGLRLR